MSYKRLEPEDITISAESVVAPLWSTDQVELTTFFTASGQVASNTGNYYYNIYEADPAVTSTANVQFSIAFGDKLGRGTRYYNTSVPGKSPSSTIYGQYRNLLFGDEDTDFTFGTETSNHIYVISVNRARYKEKLFPGSLNLTLSDGITPLKLTDNSVATTTISYVDAGRVYDIISGSNGASWNGGTGFSPLNGSYGKFLPDVGIIVLNGAALDAAGIITTDLSLDTEGDNLNSFYNILSQGARATLQSEETITSNYIFVRLRNAEFNYSTNPSNITGSGELRYDIMVNTPRAYITTIGLYNDNNELLATAKLSRPVTKEFTKEALFRVKLDY